MPHFDLALMANKASDLTYLTPTLGESLWSHKYAGANPWPVYTTQNEILAIKYFYSRGSTACTNTPSHWLYSQQEYDTAFSASSSLQIRMMDDAHRISAVFESEARRVAASAVAFESAKVKARALLKSLLAPSEWSLYEQQGIVWVIGGTSKRRYCLRNNSMVRNVSCHDDQGQVIDFLCAHPVDVPIEDVLITQKLHLEHNENGFRAVANITPRALAGMV